MNKDFYDINNLNKKLSIWYLSILLGIIEQKRDEPLTDPFLNFPFDFDDIKKILNLKEKEISKFLYFNIFKVDKILYENEETIQFDDFIGINKDLSFLFFLHLIIKYKEVINYTYPIDFIREINNLQNNNDKKYQSIIISKIIIDLIDNYKNSEIYEEKTSDELDEIIKKNNNIIEENINSFKNIGSDLTKDMINTKKVDEIYIDIINSLIKEKKFDEYESKYDILNQLDLKNINLTYTMFDGLSKTLNIKENYLDEYKIINMNDLFNFKKINFYYKLFKYILKNIIYIFHNDFLYETRIIILKNLKNEKSLDIIRNNYNIIIEDSNFNEKIKYVINIFTCSEYYYEKYINIQNDNSELIIHSNEFNNNKSLENSNDNSSNISISSNQKIKKGIKINSEQNNELAYKILNNSSFLFHIDENGKINQYDEIKYDNNIIKNIDELKKLTITNDEKLKNSFNKFLSILDNIKNNMENYFNNFFNLKFKLNFKKENDKNSNLYNLTCIYDLYFEEKKEKKFRFTNILNFENILESESFINFIDEIKELYKENNKKSIVNNPTKTQNSSNINNNLNSFSQSSKKAINNRLKYLKTILDKIKESNRDNILEIIQIKEIIDHYPFEAEFIMETNDGCFISGDRGDNLFVYNANHEKVTQLYLESNNKEKNIPTKWTLSLNETNKYKRKDGKIQLILCSKLGTKFLEVDIKNWKKMLSNEEINDSCSTYFEMRDENLVIGGEKGIKHFCPFNKLVNEIKGTYRGGIKINDNIIAFTSNSILPYGEDKLVFYDIKLMKIFKEIKCSKNNNSTISYSFTVSTNSLSIISFDEQEPKKFLLCGCKKYNNNQANGILLVNLKTYSESFFNTNDFEVYCFCQIFVFYKNDDNKEISYPTNYFFVGGFEKNKKRGKIKLFKIEEEYKENEMIIEFVQDISLENSLIIKKSKDKTEEVIFNDFRRTITSIIQSKHNGEILVTSWDRNVYLLSKPNIVYYLDYDKEEDYAYLEYDKNSKFKIPN